MALADETKKAASVAQLQELVTSLPSLIEKAVAPLLKQAIEGASTSIGTRVSSVEQGLADTRSAMPPPADFTPVLQALAEQTAAIRELAAAFGKSGAREGTATLSDGKKITLRIAEAVQ